MSRDRGKSLNLDDLDQVNGGLSLGDFFMENVAGTEPAYGAAGANTAADGSQTEDLFCPRCQKIQPFRTGYSGGRGVCTVCSYSMDL